MGDYSALIHQPWGPVFTSDKYSPTVFQIKCHVGGCLIAPFEPQMTIEPAFRILVGESPDRKHDNGT